MYTARMWQNQNLTSKPLLLPNVLYHVESSKYQKTVCIVFAEYTFFIKKWGSSQETAKLNRKYQKQILLPKELEHTWKGSTSLSQYPWLKAMPFPIPQVNTLCGNRNTKNWLWGGGRLSGEEAALGAGNLLTDPHGGPTNYHQATGTSLGLFPNL